MNPSTPLSNPISLSEKAYNYALEGELDKLKELAQQNNTSEVQKVNWNWQYEPHRVTALYAACAKGHDLVVDFLLNLDDPIDPNLASLKEVTPFSIACRNSKIKIVAKMLKDNRVDINKTTTSGISPLFTAALMAHLNVVKLILASGKNLNLKQRVTTFNNRTAAEQSRAMTYRVKLPQESQQDYVRSKANSHRIADLLDAFEKDPEAARDIIYFDDAYNFASNGELDKLKELAQSYSAAKNKELNWNWQIGPDRRTALFAACQNGHDLVVDFLLSHELVDPNLAASLNTTPLATACSSGKIKVVELLLRHPGIEVNKSVNLGITPFSFACMKGHDHVVKLLLKDPRADITRADSLGRTPFSLACKNGNLRIVQQLLLNPRIDINQSDSLGVTPFHLACYRYYSHKSNGATVYEDYPKNRLKIVHLLLQNANTDVNRPKEDNDTPLISALKRDNINPLRLLLADQRVDIHNEDAWFNAVTNGSYEAVALFLASGKSIDLKLRASKNNLTAAEWARADKALYPDETDAAYNESRPKRLRIADLLDAFERDPDLTRKKINSSFAAEYAPALFALTVFHSDDYLTFAKQTSLPEQQAEGYKRFFRIAKKLPIEMQMILCHRAYLSLKDNVSSTASEAPFRNLANNLRPIWFNPN